MQDRAEKKKRDSVHKAQRRSGRGNFSGASPMWPSTKFFGPVASSRVCDGSATWQTLGLSAGGGVVGGGGQGARVS